MDGLLGGFSALMSPDLWALMLVGVVVGIIFGAIPGLSATMAIVLFLPITFSLNVYQAFTLLVALYIGGVSGGLISAILINIPGSAMSIATCYDGHPMAESGHAKRALGIGIVFSFLGTIFSLIIMIVAAPTLADFAVGLSAYEFFALTFFALVLVSSVGGKNIFKGLAAALMGLACCMIGMAPVDGAVRYSFGITGLLQGIPLTPAVIGMFAVTEILLNATKPIKPGGVDQRKIEKIRGFGFSVKEMFSQMKNFLMSSVIGLVIGFLPGMGGSLANQVAYVAAQKTSKHPEKFGTGIMDGIVASETSNNASIGGAMIPLLALGIPGDGPTAMLLGAFTIHGLVAGPLLFTTSGNLVNLIFAAMFACSLIMIVVEFFGIRIFSKIIDVCAGSQLEGDKTGSTKGVISVAGIEDRVNNWLKNPWTLAHRPFKVVDNVYFVGTSWVSAFLLNTQKGLVLIDCAMQETLYLLVDSIRELGFNPRQIKKLLLTHGHFDHCGAARAIKEMSGCEIWLGKDDEYFFTERRDLIAFEDHVSGFPIDRFFNYSSTIDLGNFVLRPVHCPGHTPGTTSIFFDVDHRGKKLSCALHGGLGNGVLTRDYLAKKNLPLETRDIYLRSLDQVVDAKVDVVLPSHAGHCVGHDFFAIADQDDGSGAGFIDPTAWKRMLLGKRKELLDLIQTEG